MKDNSEIHTSLPTGRDPILRIVPMPTDTNYAGDVFGGWIMAQVDIAGSLPAIRRARGRVATVAVNSFVFKHPVFVGDLVSFYAEVIKVGRTSITVDVEVYAQGASDEAHSDGVYSVMNNEWIHRPTKTNNSLDMSVLKTKIKCCSR